MRYKTFLVTQLLLTSVLFLIGCPTDTAVTGESKTTEIGTMILKRSLSFDNKPGTTINWWESDITQEHLRLSALLPNGKIKNNTKYEITISGQSSADMDKFQFVFSSLKSGSETEWQDLTVTPTGYFQIKEGSFTHTEALITTGDAETTADGAFGLSNQITETLVEDGKTEAVLTGVTIIIKVDNETKTTTIDTIELKGSSAEIPGVEETVSWWESDINESKIKLSNLLPNGEIKNSAEYEVTISGQSDADMDKFQFVFSSLSGISDWYDLSTYTEALPIKKDVYFSYTKTLVTNADAASFSALGALGLSNEVTVTETTQTDLGTIKATLTNVTVTITEK